MSADVIDSMLGDKVALRIAPLRRSKPELASQMQAYYDTLFDPVADSEAELPTPLRWLIALRVACHIGIDDVSNWYRSRAREAGIADDAIAAIGTLQPYVEGDRLLVSIIRHVDLLTLTPSSTTKSDLDRLDAAGVSPRGIVAISQIVAYVSYQARLVATLRALGVAHE